MPEISALDKHACPACARRPNGTPASRSWCARIAAPRRHDVLDRETGKVREIDLVTALRELPEAERGWQATTRSVQCQSCRAVMVYDAARVGQNCEFCGSPALVDYQEIKSPIRPQGVLPFRVDRNRVRDDIRGWWRSKWFAPGRLSKTALVDTVHSIHPYWTFDATAHCPGRPTPATLPSTSRAATAGQPRRPSRAPHALGAGLGRGHAHLRRRARAGDAGRAPGAAAAGRAVPRPRGRRLRHGLPVRPCRRH